MGDRKIFTITFSISEVNELLNDEVADTSESSSTNPEKIQDRYNRAIGKLQPQNQLLGSTGKLLPIKYEITDHIGMDKDAYSFTDQKCVNFLSDDSFLPLTDDLTKHLSVLRNVLPHISKDVLKSEGTKTDLLKQTATAQQSILNGTPAADVGNKSTDEKDSVFQWDINGENSVEKKLIRELYDQSKSDGSMTPHKQLFDTSGLLTKSGAESVIKQVLYQEDIQGEKDRQEDKLIGYLTGARFLGSYKHTTQNSKTVDRLVFVTKDNILTDGFRIFPIKVKLNTNTGDKPYIIKGDDGKIGITQPGTYYGFLGSNLEQSGALNWVKGHYESTVEAMVKDGTYNAGGGPNSVIYGGRKTTSYKPSKKRSTRRIR